MIVRRSSSRNAAFKAALSFVAILVLAMPLSAQWQRGSGVPGFDTSGYAFAVHARGDVALCGTQRAGVFASSDGGGTWRAHSTGLPTTVNGAPVGVLDVMVSEQTWWCGTDGHGLWHCAPGEPWQQVPDIPRTADVLAFAEADDGTIDVGLQLYGIYRRRPVDAAFRQVLAPPLDSASINVLELEHTQRGLYAGTRYDGYVVQRADDSLWMSENDGLPGWPFTGGRLAENADGWMVCNALGFKLEGGIYRRAPNASAWELFSEGISEPIVYAFGLDTYRSTFFMSTGYFGGLGVYTWTPGEQAWTSWNDGLPDLRVEGLVCVPRSADTVRIIAGTRYHGVWWRDTVITMSHVHDGLLAGGTIMTAILLDEVDRRVDVDAIIIDHIGRSIDRRTMTRGVYIIATHNRRELIVVL